MTMTTTHESSLAAAEAQIELLEEALNDATQQLALEDRGWVRLGSDGQAFDKTYLNTAAQVCRAAAVLSPLIVRATGLRVAYVWGNGVTITADDGSAADGTGAAGAQDVNAVVQAFLDDDLNRAAFTSGQAREVGERALATDGNLFLALPTDPVSGRVQVRTVPFTQITDVVTNPEDRNDVWFYRRTYSVTATVPDPSGARTVNESRDVYHPAVTFRPRSRPQQLNSRTVMWDQPIVHVAVNRQDEWTYGVGDMYAALPWARGYNEFLQDWAKLMRSLSKIAWAATSKTGAGGAKVRQAMSAQTDAGAVATLGADQQLTAVSKSGATIDAGSGRPLAAQVASAVGLPVTLLLADPGVTGARAVAETLDEPTYLAMNARRALWTDVFNAVLNYVIDAAIRAPQGQLRGTVTTDPATGRDRLVLLGDQARGIRVDWPDLSKTDPATLVQAIAAAHATDTLPPLLVARELMAALGVEDVDEWLSEITDDNGNFVSPASTALAGSALGAVAAGQFPTDSGL